MQEQDICTSPPVTAKLGSKLYTIQPEVDGSFLCNLPEHSGCLVSYKSRQDMEAHLSEVVAMRLSPISDHLSDTLSLRQAGLVINVTHRVLICISCRAAISPLHHKAHLKAKHDHLLSPGDAELIIKTCHHALVSSTLPKLGPEPIEEVQGLLVVEGLLCMFDGCGHHRQGLSSLRRHHQEAHPGWVPPAFPPDPQPVQRLNQGQNSSYFPIRRLPPSCRSLPEEIVSCVLEDNPEQLHEIPASADARNVSPWNRHTQWHALLRDISPSQAMDLVQRPNKQELPNLEATVRSLYCKARSTVDHTPVLTLQILNSPDPAKSGISNHPFCKHQNEATDEAYVRVLVCLVACLLRLSRDDCPLSVSYSDHQLSLIKDAERDPTESSVHALLLSVWTCVWLPTQGRQDPTLLFLALQSMKVSGQLKDPHLVTPVIAKLEYSIRLIVLLHLHTFGEEKTFEEASQVMRRWHQEKVESTFNSLRTLQHFASSLVYNTQSLPKIWWIDRTSYKVMLYRGHTVSFQQIQDMLRKQEREMMELWESRVMLGSGASVPHPDLKEDLTNCEPGYSFSRDPRNLCFEASKHLLLKAVVEDDRLSQRFFITASKDKVVWNVLELKKWLSDYALLHLHFLVRCSLTAGSPARGTELTCMLLSNTATQPLRNLVSFGQYITLLVTYSKMTLATKRDKIVPHALDGFMSDLLVQDLALARPFAVLAARVCYPLQPEISRLYLSHVFVNQKTLFTTEDLTRGLRQASSGLMDVDLTVNSWRHIMTAFRRKSCNSVEDAFEDASLETVEALQEGHSRSTENRIYGITQESLLGIPEDVLPLFIDTSLDWQFECGVVPGGVRKPYNQATMHFFRSMVSSEEIKRPSKSSREKIEDVLEHVMSRADKQHEDFMDAVQDIKRLIESTVASPSPSPVSSLEPPMLNRGVTTSDAALPTPSPEAPDHADLSLSALHTVLGRRDAFWTCPEQRDAVVAVLKGKTDVVAVLGTGQGKTMVAIIPAVVEEELALFTTTVIFLPLTSLIIDYARRLKGMGVSFQRYEPGTPLQQTKSILLVSVDAAQTEGFSHAIGVLNEARPVARYVFDEAHLAGTSVGFRKSMERVQELRTLSVPFVLLSGSLGARAYAFALNAFNLCEGTVTFRTSCNRPNLSLEWQKPHASWDSICAAVRAEISNTRLGAKDRVLVYVTSMDEGYVLSNTLSLPFYHGGLSPERSKAVYNSWFTGGSLTQTLVCTSALGCGNDHPGVRLVIHAGTPYEMVDYYQEISRAGRDGAPARCVMFPYRSLEGGANDRDVQDLGGRVEMSKALADERACIRLAITSHLDSAGLSCCSDAENLPCSRCSRPAAPAKRPADFDVAASIAKRQRRARKLSEPQYFARFKEALEKFRNTCAFCVYDDFTTPDGDKHEPRLCPVVIKLGGFSDYCAWKKFTYPPQSRICYRCHVPQDKDNVFHPQFSSNQPCGTQDIVPAIAWCMSKNAESLGDISNFLGVPLTSKVLFSNFLRGPVLAGERSNMSALFLAFAETFHANA